MREDSPPHIWRDAESTRSSSSWHPPLSGQCTLVIIENYAQKQERIMRRGGRGEERDTTTHLIKI